MDQRQKELRDLLRAGDDNNVRFYETKQLLLAKGYSDDEIAQAIAEVPYDGKKNEPKNDDVVAKSFHENPELAHVVGHEMLEDHRRHLRDKVLTHMYNARMNGMWGGKDAAAAAFWTGLPFFPLIFIGIAIGLLVVWLDLPPIVSRIYWSGISLVWLWNFYNQYVRKRKRNPRTRD